MTEVYARIHGLAATYKSVRLYPPAPKKMAIRRFSAILGRPDQHLLELYAHTNGASLLDYCVVGCGNKRIADLTPVPDKVVVWDTKRARDFVPFIVTTSGEMFGYLVSSKPIQDLPTHPVSYCADPGNDPPILIASTVLQFFHGFLDAVEDQLGRDPEALGVNVEDWPCNLNYWKKRDPDILKYYP
jgi:hypothetical protein